MAAEDPRFLVTPAGKSLCWASLTSPNDGAAVELSQKALTGLLQLAVTWGMRIIGVLIALWLARIVANWLASKLARRLGARRFDVTLSKFFANLVRYAVIVAAVIGCLGVFGIQTTSFAAVLAAAGLAIGMALQGTLGNFAAGVMLLAFRPFKVGDLVKIGGHLGRVASIELFTTELTTLDNRLLIVPNGEIFGKTIENLTHYDTRRVDISVGATYSDSTENTRQVLTDCLADIKGILKDPEPQIFLKSLGESSVDWEVRVWCKTPDYWDVHQDTIRAVKKAMDGANVGIPFPQRDLHFDPEVVKALAQAR